MQKGMFIMSKTLTSKKQTKISELHKTITKDLEVFDLPTNDIPDPNFKPETREEWLKEMEYEESLMTQAEKDEAKKRYHATLKRMAELYPSKFKGISA